MFHGAIINYNGQIWPNMKVDRLDICIGWKIPLNGGKRQPSIPGRLLLLSLMCYIVFIVKALKLN